MATTYVKWKNRKTMTDNEWVEARRSGIGGSDAGSVIGMNPYGSPYTVYYDKTTPNSQKEVSENMRQGTDLEEYVARRFCEETGKKVKRFDWILRSKANPFMIADVDRMIVGENAILECKTTLNRDNYSFVGDDIPAYWKAQCLHYMSVTGAQKVYLSVLVFGTGFHVVEIDRETNASDICALENIERDFWKNHVEKEIPPVIDGSDRATALLASQYPEANNGLPPVDLTMCDSELERLAEIKVQMRTLDEEKSAIENSIKQVLGEAAEGECNGYSVTWKNRTSNRFDTKRFQEDHADLYAAYVTPTNTRTFLFKVRK